jgi:hypothetical protein
MFNEAYYHNWHICNSQENIYVKNRPSKELRTDLGNA